MANLINWHDVSDNFRELRRNIGQVAVAARRAQPPEKRRRVDLDLDVTLCPDKFPSVSSLDSLNDPARFLVDAVHSKIFIGAVFSLMKFGDSIMLFPNRDGLTVKACNTAKTAAGTFNFGIEFFGAIHTFEFPKEKPCCRVFIKPFLTVLKKTELSKHLENFIIDLDPASETMVFRVQMRNGIKKLYKIPLSDVLANSLPRLIPRDESSNAVVLMPNQLTEALDIVGKNGIEMGMWASKKDIIFHTLFQTTNAVGQWRNAATRLNDLINVRVRKLVNLAFSVRDLRALSKYADKYNSSVSLYFKTAKSPLFAVMDIPGLCDATFTLSTSAVQSSNAGRFIERMIPETTVNIPLATQSLQNQSNTATLTRTSNTLSQFQPVEIDQSHELVRSYVNTQSPSYWRKATAVRELEIVDIP